MMRIKLSVRFILILTACVAVTLWWLGPLAEPRVNHTSRQLDVAIVGAGYFRVLDEEACEARFTRTGQFELDRDRVLSIEIAGELRPIDPPIVVPPDAKVVEITDDGYVRAAAPAGPQTLGRLQLSRFRSDLPFENPWVFNAANGSSNLEKTHDPSLGAGTLQQGYLEYSPPVDRTILSALALALIATFVLDFIVDVVNRRLGITSLELLS